MNHDPAPRRPPMPPPERPAPPEATQYSSPAAKANWATALFTALWIVTVISVIATFYQNTLIQRLLHGQELSNQILSNSDTLVALISYLYIATFVAAATVFLIWLHRCSTNLAALGTENQEYTPFKAIFWWFIPFASLIHPYWVVKELWRESRPDPSQPKVSVLLGPWWLTWLISNFIGTSTRFFSSTDPSLSELQTRNYIAITSDIISIISLTLVIIIVRRITSNQELKHSQLPPRH